MYLFKLYQRPIITIENQRYIVTSLDDVKEAKQLFDKIEQTTKTGTDKKILDFYEKYVRNQTTGSKLEALIEEYNKGEERTNNPISDSTIRHWLKRLNVLGWVQIKKGEDISDRRKDTYYPLKFSKSSAISETAIDLKLKLEKDFDLWLETIALKGVSTIEFFIIGESTVNKPLTEIKKFIIGETLPAEVIVSKPEQELKSENKPKIDAKHEIKPDSLNKVLSTEQSKTSSRVCGDCGRFHLPNCEYIGNNFQTLPADKWAGELRCWIPKQPEMPEYQEEAPTVEA